MTGEIDYKEVKPDDMKEVAKNTKQEGMSSPGKDEFRGSIGLRIRRHDGTIGVKNPSWLALKNLENDRRVILKRVELPYWRILTFLKGTVYKTLFIDPILWITMGIFVTIRVYAHLSVGEPDVQLFESSDINIIGGFLSFFLVFFVNQTQTRFYEMFGFSKACAGHTQDVAALAVMQFPRDKAEQIIRHMNAAQIAGYVGMGGPYSKRKFFSHYNNTYNLMSDEEMEMISHLDMDSGSDVMKELITWCNHDVAEMKQTGVIDSIEASLIHSKILDFRAAMDGMYDYCEQPPHFFYVHFLCLISAIYLPLFALDNAYASGWGDDIDVGIELLNGVIVLLQCAFVIGLRLLGQKMVDPYGDDYEDLGVITYVEATLHICRIIFTSKGNTNKRIYEAK